MKRTIIVFLFCALGANVFAQGVELLYAEQDSTAENCTSMTDCVNNQVCYFVEYTPAITGVLTSYTMGFIGNCSSIGVPVLSNASCVMTDNSNTLDACAGFNSFQLVVSGNGVLNVIAGEPVLVHQVCFQLNSGYQLDLVKDQFLDLTANIDSTNGQSYTEFLDYDTQMLTNDVCNCFQLTEDSGSPSQIVECLEPIVPIKYQLNNCDTAIVSNLAPGLSAQLINGVINIEGTPTNGGAFTFLLQAADYCDCNPSINAMQVDSSAVMIESNCYNSVEDAISEYNNGQIIRVIKDLVSNPNALQALNNVNLRIKKNIKWQIKNE